MKMLMQHVQAEPVPPSQRTELTIPRELDELVLACLKKDPRQAAAGRRGTAGDGLAVQDVRDLEPAVGAGWWEAHLPELCGPLTIVEPERHARVAALLMA